MLDEPPERTASRDRGAINDRGFGLARSDDTAGAETALREADAAGSTAASFTLARLVAEQKEGHSAIAAFQRAVRRGHVAPGYSLGGLLAESGDARGLVNAYRVAAERGDQEAAYQLGLLYLERDDLESARSAFAMADKLGHPWAALGLGEILEQTGDRSGAIAAYRRASDRRVTAAHARLEALLAESGDTDESTAFRLTGEASFSKPAQRWTRQRLAWTAGTAAALAALLLVALLILLPTAHPKPAARPGTGAAASTALHQRQTTGHKSGAGRSRPTATSQAKARTTGPVTRAAAGGLGSHAPQGGKHPSSRSPTISFTAKQSALLASVPGTAHAECLPRTQQPLPRSKASIRCFASSAAITVRYYRYSSLSLLRHMFHNYRAWFAARHRLRDCAGRTHGAYFQGSASSTIAGRWACFYNDHTLPQSACIDWADYGLLIFGSACQADGDFTVLARWWTHAGPVPASGSGLLNRY